MAYNNFMNSIRTFFGFHSNPPVNDFRNPIWSSDDEDDGDELYTRQQIDVFDDAVDIHQEIKKQMQDMVKNFGSLFGEFRSFFNEDRIDAFTSMPHTDDLDSEKYDANTGKNLRDYYLNTGYHNFDKDQPKEDMDLDGKISSNEISGMLKSNTDSPTAGSVMPFNGNIVPTRTFCQTIITTSVTKPDGSVETRRIIKKGNEVIEETTTSSIVAEPRGTPGLDQLSSSGFIYSHVMSELSSLFQNFH